MSILFSKHKKLVLNLILILLISSLGIFILGVSQAQAFWPFDKIGNLLKDAFDPYALVIGVIAALGTAIHTLVSLFFWLASMLLEIAFGLEKFTDAGVVQMGWKITRDLANMFFVLILLAIAFATILRIETYGMKALLPKLIIVALLINFSLVLAGVVIDFSQVLTHFFYDEISSEVGISAQIAKVLEIQKVPEINEEASAPEKLAAGTAGVFMMIFSIFLGIILILCASFALGAGAFFLIVRLIVLWILLILAPLAWLLSILPNTAHLFRQWWSSFLKWTFFAPIYAFFIYLAIKAAEAGSFTSIIQAEMENIVNASGWKETLWSTLMSSPSLFLQFLVIIGLLFGGLIVAQKMGVYGAQGAMGFAKGIGDKVAKWPGRRAQMAATRPAGAVEKGLGRAGDWMGKSRLGRWTGLAAITRQAGRGPRAFAEKERAAMAELEKKYQPWASDHIKRERPSASPRAKAAMDKIMAGRGEFKKDEKAGFLVTEKDIQDALKIAKRYEQHKEILKARPDLAPLAGQNIEETVSKIKPADLEKLQTEALIGEAGEEVKKAIQNQLTNPNGRWKNSHLSKMNEVNPSVAVEIKQKVIDDPERGPFRQDVETYLESDAGKAIFGEPKPRAE